MPVHGSCHCKTIAFEVNQPPPSVTRCNCTFCSKRGVLWAYFAPDQVKFTSHEHDVVYSKEGSPIRHHHCAVCGCGTYTESPEWIDFQPHPTRTRIGINARLLDDFDIDSLPIEFLDGRNLW